MAKKEEKRLNAKQRAYEKKQEKKGASVVMWIFAVLIVLGILYAMMSVYMFS